MKCILAAAILIAGFVFTASGQHEYAPLELKKIKYKDWTYESVRTGEEINLREFTKDKKLVLVYYFASWCHSSRYQSPMTQRLYEKYKDKGFGIIGVSLYSSVDSVLTDLVGKNITFPVVVESQLLTDRKDSLHYEYRTQTGDNRKWGTPWNIFLVPENLRKNGDTLIKKTFVANGELVEEEAEKFIREHLGLPPEQAKVPQNAENNVFEVCEEEAGTDFQKP